MHRTAVPPLNARLCRRLAALATAGGVGFLAVDCLLWLVPAWAPIVARGMANLQDQPITMTPMVRAVGLLCSSLLLCVLGWGFWSARILFQRLAEGLIFEAETGVLLRRFGQALLVYAALLSWLVTHLNAPGQRLASFGISDQEITLAIVGTLILSLGSAMADAARLAEDHRQIV